MPLRVAADVELITVGYLRSRTEITGLVSTRVFTEVPAQPTFPLLVITRIGGIGAWPGWLDTARIQVDAWGTSKANARQIAATALAVLLEMPGVHAAGVVTHVAQDLGFTWAPDDLTDRPRYIVGVQVDAHPIPS